MTLSARVAEVDDARETVDQKGRISGIRATGSFASMLPGFAVSAGAVDPMLLGWTLSSSLSVFRLPESEVILPTGAELHVRLVQAIVSTARSMHRLLLPHRPPTKRPASRPSFALSPSAP